MPNVAPEIGHIIDGPLVQAGIVLKIQAVFGVYMLHELPHLGSLGAPVSPELDCRRHLVGVAALGAAVGVWYFKRVTFGPGWCKVSGSGVVLTWNVG